MTTLRKPVLYKYVAGVTGSVGSPGQPYVPAHTSVVPVTTCSYSPAINSALSSYVALFNPRSLAETLALIDRIAGPDAIPRTSNMVYRCTTTSKVVNFPAQPYIPPTPAVVGALAQTITDYQLGWSGRADSIVQLASNGGFSFSVPSTTVGAVVGISNAPAATGYGDITHGIYVSRSTGRIYESGQDVGILFAVTSSDVLTISRVRGIVTYTQNSTVLYTSSVPSTGTVQLAAALYSGGDTVTNAALALGGEGVGSLGAFTGYAYAISSANTGSGQGSFGVMQSSFGMNGGSFNRSSAQMGPLIGAASASSHSNIAVGVGSLQPLFGVSYPFTTGAGSLLPMTSLAGVAWQFGNASMLAMTGAAEGYPSAPSWGLASGAVSTLTAAGSVLCGEIGGSVSSLLAFDGLASDHPYGSSQTVLQPLVSYGEDTQTPNDASVTSLIYTLDTTYAQNELYVVFTSSMLAVGLFTVQQLRDAAVQSNLSASSTFTSTQILDAILKSYASLENLGFDSGDLQAWVLNTKNSGTTRYTGYNFNSFAKIGAFHYGAMSDGIYKLSGATDNGAAINAAVNLGKNNFNTSALKTLVECYVGVASNGKVVLKVVADGQTYFYTARDSSKVLQTQRIDVGRGFRANFFELEIQNTAGGAFDLASVEFSLLPLSRRI